MERTSEDRNGNKISYPLRYTFNAAMQRFGYQDNTSGSSSKVWWAVCIVKQARWVEKRHSLGGENNNVSTVGRRGILMERRYGDPTSPNTCFRRGWRFYSQPLPF
jgi:L,D-peptidoglycan transpeptidase YkuD (ErfK/YbiS/YcfS/YnhG family)